MDKKITRRELIKRGGRYALAATVMGGTSSIINQNSAFGFEQNPKTLPNIILINVDDLGYGDLGCYGSLSLKTPNIDSLAKNGLRFTDFCASAPVCSPSRYGLLTGRYPMRGGFSRALFPTDRPLKNEMLGDFYYGLGRIGLLDILKENLVDGIPVDDVTLPDILRESGYKTGMVGKWHLGDTPGYLPNDNGFDFFFGVPYSNDMSPFPLYRNCEIIEEDIKDQGTLTKRYTKNALEFIDDSKGSPFFFYFAHTFPHIPLFASDDFRGKSLGGLYGDTVEEVDWSVGEIIRKVEELGLTDNTLIIFTSDNGPWYEGSQGGLRGCKGLSFEGGFRVPMIAKWPGVIRPGSVTETPATNMDVFPTILGIVGANLPAGRTIDGMDIMPVLKGKKDFDHKPFFYYHGNKIEAVRMGKWKYHRKHSVYIWPSNLQKKGPWLFDMDTDHFERYDVSMKYPDIAKELEATIAKWEESFLPLTP